MILLVAALILLLGFNAFGHTWLWRGTAPSPYPWYGGAAFAWGCWLLAIYLTWPVLKEAMHL